MTRQKMRVASIAAALLVTAFAEARQIGSSGEQPIFTPPSFARGAVASRYMPSGSKWPIDGASGEAVGDWGLTTNTATALNATIDGWAQRLIYPQLTAYSNINLGNMTNTNFTCGTYVKGWNSDGSKPKGWTMTQYSFSGVDLGQYMAASNRDYSAAGVMMNDVNDIFGSMVRAGINGRALGCANASDGVNLWLIPKDKVDYDLLQFPSWTDSFVDALCLTQGFLASLGELRVYGSWDIQPYKDGVVDIIRGLVPDDIRWHSDLDDSTTNLTWINGIYDIKSILSKSEDDLYDSSMLKSTYASILAHQWAYANDVISLCSRSLVGNGKASYTHVAGHLGEGLPFTVPSSGQQPTYYYVMENAEYIVGSSATFKPTGKGAASFGSGTAFVPFEKLSLDGEISNGIPAESSTQSVTSEDPVVGWYSDAITFDVTATTEVALVLPDIFNVIDDVDFLHAYEAGEIDEAGTNSIEVCFAWDSTSDNGLGLCSIISVSNFLFNVDGQKSEYYYDNAVFCPVASETFVSNDNSAVKISCSKKVHQKRVSRTCAMNDRNSDAEYNGEINEKRAQYDRDFDKQYIPDYAESIPPTPHLKALYDSGVLSGELYGFYTVAAVDDEEDVRNLLCNGKSIDWSATGSARFMCERGQKFSSHASLRSGLSSLASDVCGKLEAAQGEFGFDLPSISDPHTNSTQTALMDFVDDIMKNGNSLVVQVPQGDGKTTLAGFSIPGKLAKVGGELRVVSTNYSGSLSYSTNTLVYVSGLSNTSAENVDTESKHSPVMRFHVSPIQVLNWKFPACRSEE